MYSISYLSCPYPICLQHFLSNCCQSRLGTTSWSNMRRFSSEGSLLDLDFLPWKSKALKNPDFGVSLNSETYTPHLDSDELNARLPGLTPIILEPKATPSERRELNREHSFSVENLTELGKLNQDLLQVCAMNEGCRAYSDSQLAPTALDRCGGVEHDGHPPPSASSNLLSKSHHRHQHRAKLSAAKLHLKSLFGQVGRQAQNTSEKVWFPRKQPCWRRWIWVVAAKMRKTEAKRSKMLINRS